MLMHRQPCNHLAYFLDLLGCKIGSNLVHILVKISDFVSRVTTLLTSPIFNASSAVIISPVIINSFVFAGPRKLRNQCTHRKLINVLFKVGSDKAGVSFIVSPKTKLELITLMLKDIDEDLKNIKDRLEIIPFLEEGLTTVKSLVQSIMNNQSRLR